MASARGLQEEKKIRGYEGNFTLPGFNAGAIAAAAIDTARYCQNNDIEMLFVTWIGEEKESECEIGSSRGSESVVGGGGGVVKLGVWVVKLMLSDNWRQGIFV